MQMTSPERLAAPLRLCAADCSGGALCRHIWRMQSGEVEEWMDSWAGLCYLCLSKDTRNERKSGFLENVGTLH